MIHREFCICVTKKVCTIECLLTFNQRKSVNTKKRYCTLTHPFEQTIEHVRGLLNHFNKSSPFSVGAQVGTVVEHIHLLLRR